VKKYMRGIVEELEQETTKPDQEPDENKIKKKLLELRAMSSDIFEVALTTFANPVAGGALVIKKIGDKIKAEAG